MERQKPDRNSSYSVQVSTQCWEHLQGTLYDKGLPKSKVLQDFEKKKPIPLIKNVYKKFKLMDYHWEWSEDIMIGIALTPLYFKQKMEKLIE